MKKTVKVDSDRVELTENQRLRWVDVNEARRAIQLTIKMAIEEVATIEIGLTRQERKIWEEVLGERVKEGNWEANLTDGFVCKIKKPIKGTVK